MKDVLGVCAWRDGVRIIALLVFVALLPACASPSASPAQSPAVIATVGATPTATMNPTLPPTISPSATPAPAQTPTSTDTSPPTPTVARTAAPTRPASLCPQGCATPPPGCAIKGNISASGEKIYHMPGQKYYADTVISPGKGERWFCTEDEARANGWRKSLI